MSLADGSDSRSNWNLECWFLWREENWRAGRKTLRARSKNQQQTQPTFDTGSRNRNRATAVGGKCSYHCVIPASQKRIYMAAMLYGRNNGCLFLWEKCSFYCKTFSLFLSCNMAAVQNLSEVFWGGLYSECSVTGLQSVLGFVTCGICTNKKIEYGRCWM